MVELKENQNKKTNADEKDSIKRTDSECYEESNGFVSELKRVNRYDIHSFVVFLFKFISLFIFIRELSDQLERIKRKYLNKIKKLEQKISAMSQKNSAHVC